MLQNSEEGYIVNTGSVNGFWLRGYSQGTFADRFISAASQPVLSGRYKRE